VDDDDGEEKFIEPKTESVSGKYYFRYDSDGDKNNLNYVQLTISTEPLKK